MTLRSRLPRSAVVLTLLLVAACSFDVRAVPPYSGDGQLPGGDSVTGDALADDGGPAGDAVDPCGGCVWPDTCGGAGRPGICDHPPGWFPLGPSELAAQSEEVSWYSAARGGVSHHTDDSHQLALAVGSDNQPVVAWRQAVGNGTEIYVRRFSTAGWVEVGTGSAHGGGVSNTAEPSWYPALALDSNDYPVVAWQEISSSGNFEIYLRYFDGADWVELAGSATGGGISASSGGAVTPSLALDASDNPIVAWADSTNAPADLFVRRFTGTAWVEVGAGSATGGGVSATALAVSNPKLVLDGNDTPTVAWYQSGNPAQLLLKQYDGLAWQELAGSATGGGVTNASFPISPSPALALDSLGRPWVAFHNQISSGAMPEIFVTHFNGNSWQYVDGDPSDAASGSVSDTGGISGTPTISLLSGDDPVVTWTETVNTASEVYVKLNEATWSEFGSGSASGDGISATAASSLAPMVAVGPNDRPVIAWVENRSGGDEIYLRRWDGSSWAELMHAPGSSVSASAGHSSQPSMALQADGTAAVVWHQLAGGPGQVYGKRLRSGSWAPIVAGSASGTGIPGNDNAGWHGRVALTPSGRSVVAWGETSFNDQVHLAKSGSGGWESIGPDSMGLYGISATGTADAVDLALDSSGLPVVAWEDDGSNISQIFVKRFNGSAWVEVGPDSAINDGISATPGDSIAPSLVVGSDGQPVVAWQEATTTGQQIYVKRFNASTGANAWVEAGLNSASGTGVSDTVTDSRYPSLAMASDGTLVVAWEEQVAAGQSEVYLRALGTGTDTWSELGNGSATGLGISDGAAWSGMPALAAGDSGRLGLAWLDQAAGRQEIYFKLYDGSAWREIYRSASGGGVSNSAEDSLWPEVSAAGSVFCVSWAEAAPLDSEILLRCTDGT